MNTLVALRQNARSLGIQTSFIDSSGQKRFASEETLRLLLDRMRPAREEPPALVEPVLVSWHGSPGLLKTWAVLRPREIALRLEGESKAVPLRHVKIRERGESRHDLELPIAGLPAGYHELIYRFSKAEDAAALLISAPKKLYTDSYPQWGVFAPLYAVHSGRSWGAGSFSDWQQLCEWVGRCGGAVAGTLPVMSAFLQYPKCEPSPYSPASRLFWNEFFIDITAAPEFASSRRAQKLFHSPRFQKALQKFRAAEWIDYPAQWAARREILAILAEEFFQRSSSRRDAFEAGSRRRPELESYARFRAACDQQQGPWRTWPAPASGGELRPADYEKKTCDFYGYAQWLAQEQADQVLASCRAAGVKFYLDLPLGVDPDGFDAWRHRHFFARDVSAGAPPDGFFTKGQDWGFAPLDPRRIRTLKYAYVIDYLRFQMRHTGLLRIDHVMGLHRLWWVPHGHPASAGAYVSYPAHEFYAILSLESHRHKTMLVGENLGTVPPEVNESMDRHGLRRMYVLQYEQPVQGPLRQPDPQVVASLNTHDMPMFAAHCRGLDIADRAALGLVSKKELPAQKRERAAMRANLKAFLKRKKMLPAGSLQGLLDGALQFLARSPAEIVLATLEDLWGETRSQNVPGTSTERPNWRRKMTRPLEEIIADKRLAERLQRLLTRPRSSRKAANRFNRRKTP